MSIPAWGSLGDGLGVGGFGFRAGVGADVGRGVAAGRATGRAFGSGATAAVGSALAMFIG